MLNPKGWWAIACAVVVALAGFAFWLVPSSPPPAPKPAFADLELIRAAEKISDPVQRCRTYPDPPEFRWDPKVVHAACALLGWKALSLTEIDEALSTGNAASIDQAFKSYLESSFKKDQHGFLTWAFKQAFDKDSAEASQTAKRWVELSPDSAFALTARGTQLVAAAWGARGQELSVDTPSKNFRLMEKLAGEAVDAFQAALKRSPRMITAYYGLIRAAQLVSDQDLVSEASAEALKLDPADHLIYDSWFDAVKPKWGGSNALMLAVVTTATRHVDENPLIARVAGRLPCVQADPLYVDDDRQRLALYRVAAATVPVLCFLVHAGDTAELVGKDDVSVVRYFSQSYRFLRDDHSILRRALALQRMGRREWAIESIDDLLQREPNKTEALLYKGWVLEGNDKLVEAEATFLQVIEIDPLNREASTELVHLYAHGLNQREKAIQIVERLKTASRPRAWLLAAVLDGKDENAKCRENLQKYLDLVAGEPIDDYEQRDIDRAKQQLLEFDKQLASPPQEKSS